MAVTLLSLLLAGITIAISSVITIVQFQYSLATSADQFSPVYNRMLQHVHSGDLINPGAKESSPGHGENTEEEFELDTLHLADSSCSTFFVLI